MRQRSSLGQRIAGSGMDFLDAGALRILEDLVKDHSPHYNRRPRGIFDRRVRATWVYRLILNEPVPPTPTYRKKQRGGLFPPRYRRIEWVQKMRLQRALYNPQEEKNSGPEPVKPNIDYS